METYQRCTYQVYKALARPALYFGLPLQLFYIICAVPFLLGLYFSLLFWIIIPTAVFFLGLLSKKDAQIYNLLYLKFKTWGSIKANSYYGARAIFAQRYEPVEIFTLTSKSYEPE